MATNKNGAWTAIDRAKNHFNNQPIREISVGEWADENGDAFVFFCKPFTLQDQAKLQFAIKNQSEADALAEVLVLKALDAEGNKLFAIGDKVDLRNNVDAGVLAKVANKIMGSNVEDLEKN